MVTRLDTHHPLNGHAASVGDHDPGLEHGHNWARERTNARQHKHLIADASATRVPSSVHHDDAIYLAG